MTTRALPSQTSPNVWNRNLRPVAAIALALSLGSCGGGVPSGGSGPTISSESFVKVMVQLRSSALLHSSGYLPEGEPERILEENGLVADDLRRFVEIHGVDVPLMASLWQEIDQRVNEARALREP